MTYQFTSNCADLPRSETKPSFALRILETIKCKVEDGIATYRRNRQARINRDAFRQMLLLDNELLDDIGVTRSNVEWASQLPLHESASQALESTMKRARPRKRP